MKKCRQVYFGKRRIFIFDLFSLTFSLLSSLLNRLRPGRIELAKSSTKSLVKNGLARTRFAQKDYGSIQMHCGIQLDDLHDKKLKKVMNMILLAMNEVFRV